MPRHRFLFLSPHSLIHAGFFDERIFVSLKPFNSECTRAFPLFNGILLVPCVHQSALSRTHLISRVSVLHIFISSCDSTSGSRRRFCFVAHNLHFANTKLGRDRLRHCFKVFITSIRVHRTNRRIKVVHIALHVTELFVYLLCAFTALKGFSFAIHAVRMSTAPLRERLTEIFCRDNMFPLYFSCSLRVGRRFKAGRKNCISMFVELYSAIYRCPLIVNDISFQQLLGFIKAVN